MFSLWWRYLAKNTRLPNYIERLFKDTYPGLLQTSKMEDFATFVKGFHPLTIVAKHSLLYVCRSPGYASQRRWMNTTNLFLNINIWNSRITLMTSLLNLKSLTSLKRGFFVDYFHLFNWEIVLEELIKKIICSIFCVIISFRHFVSIFSLVERKWNRSKIVSHHVTAFRDIF